MHDFAIGEAGAHDETAVLRPEHDDGIAGRNQFTFLGEASQDRPIARRDDRSIVPVELRGVQPGFSHCGLRAQILELLEADDLIAVQPLSARDVALGFLEGLPRLLDLRVDLRLFDFSEALAFANPLTFAERSGSGSRRRP